MELFDIHKDMSVTPEDVSRPRASSRVTSSTFSRSWVTASTTSRVPGIGPKTAAKLVLEYGGIDEIYEHIDEIKGKRHENLVASKDAMLLDRDLVRLWDDAEIEPDLDACAVTPSSLPVDAMEALFRELGFGRFGDELKKLLRRLHRPGR